MWAQLRLRKEARFWRLIGVSLAGVLALGAALLAASAAGPTPIAFKAPVTYTKMGAVGMAAADFDRDGRVDLAVGGSDSVSVFSGNGDGTLQPAIDVAPGGPFNRLIAPDVDGDGRLDIVVADAGTDTVDVLLNREGRTFAAAVSYRVGHNPNAVAAADFNADGKLDLAVSNFASKSMSVLINNGDGTFGAAKLYPGGEAPGGVVAGDFNGDGKTDLAMCSNVSNDISLYFGNGVGGFSTPTSLRWNKDYHTDLVMGDFNGDGKLDLVVSEYFQYGIGLLFGNGDGSFQRVIDYPANQYPLTLQAVDVDRDGRLDLVAANAGTNYLSVLQNGGGGVLRPAARFTSGVRNTRTMAIGDFNGDGLPDVAVAADTTNAVAVLLNDTRLPPRQP